REFLIRSFSATIRARFPVTLMNEIHHVFERSPGEENFIHAFLAHELRVVVRDRSPATAENFDVVRARLAKKIDNFGEKLDLAAIVTGNADRANVFLDRGANDIAYRSMIT